MSSQVDTPADLAGGTYKGTVREKASQLKQELIRQTLDDIESWRKAVDLEWAQTHPESPHSPIPPEEIEGYRNTVRNEYYEWVEPAFEKYLEPDPDATNPMIASLRTIESSFGGSQDDAGNFSGANSALSRINDVRTDMSQWQGDLQVNFIDNFVSPLQTASINQAAVAKVVREQLECNKILYIRYRKGIIELLDKSIQAVQTLNNGKDPKSFTWGTLVGISIGTGLTLGPAGWAIAGAVLIAGSTLSQGLVPDPPKTNELSAPTAQEVAVKVSEAMIKMDGDMVEEERKVEQALKNLLDTIGDARTGNGPLAVPEPAISSARPGEITDGSLRPHD
ncbi:hypothetical protein O7626_02590 [Micromonospora sp. WMMD1102]|uniref:hypothetical protein n=1 Tax=Micromonospora sp. WMMD1102 TaxID=3016105 RepID=UPI0024156D72|nr:hypothetical protein [Micromonospora sp. WMMD1102]MDG4784830.1 hypothetical protein [Micromonospora sp. WMMD1102]